ncbi:MAG: hypothetical protein AAFN78_01055 [Pseudomonadota bacterium]
MSDNHTLDQAAKVAIIGKRAEELGEALIAYFQAGELAYEASMGRAPHLSKEVAFREWRDAAAIAESALQDAAPPRANTPADT